MKLKTLLAAAALGLSAPLIAVQAADAGTSTDASTSTTTTTTTNTGQTPTAVTKTKHYVADSALTTKVKAALLKEKNLKSLGISVETTSGVVTLSGTVPSTAEKEQAVSVAKHIKGVKDVHDALELKTDATTSG